ncbi:MAG: hypothetical protein MJ168_04125 [Clostridia bacterium]|nr:hypothetical protein [Clostridia bacterium]
MLVRSQHSTLKAIYPDLDFIADTKLCKFIEYYVVSKSSYETENHLYCFFRKDRHLNILHDFRPEQYSLWHDYCTDVYHVNQESLHNCSENATGTASVVLTNRDIVLMPYAHSTDLISMGFWIKLAKELQQRNYKIYTNIAPYEKPIDGTEALCLPLYEVCAAFENSAGCISMRSGICDLLAIKSQTSLYILNSSPYWTPIWDVTYFRNSGIHNYLYNTEEEMIDTILQFF